MTFNDIHISIEKNILKKAKHKALDLDISFSKYLRDLLKKDLNEDE